MSLGAAPFQATPMQLINKRVFLVFSAKNVIVLLAVAHLFGCKASHSAAMPMDKGEKWKIFGTQSSEIGNRSQYGPIRGRNLYWTSVSVLSIQTELKLNTSYSSYKVVKAKVRSLFGHLGKTIFSVADSRESTAPSIWTRNGWNPRKIYISIEANFCHMRKKIINHNYDQLIIIKSNYKSKLWDTMQVKIMTKSRNYEIKSHHDFKTFCIIIDFISYFDF